MAHPLRYEAVAYLKSGSACPMVQTATSDFEALLAASPLAAARKWYWRLSKADRLNCVCVEVRPWNTPGQAWASKSTAFPAYTGPTMAFDPRRNWSLLEAVKRG